MERESQRRRRARRPKRSRLGNQIGALFCLAGFVVVWVGWNGAASYDLASRQFPYLISGGIVGMCLVNLGIGLFVVQSQRVERVRLEENLAALSRILETLVRVSGGAPAGGPRTTTAESAIPAGPGPVPRPEYEPDRPTARLPG